MYGSTPPQVQDLNYEHLVVYGLERSVNDADLREYFEKFGKVAVAKVSMWCVCVFTCMRVCQFVTYNMFLKPMTAI